MRPIDYFDRGAERFPNNICLASPTKKFSYQQVQHQSEKIAAGLYTQGFLLGDSVAVYSPNDPLAVICVLATHRAGGAWVPVNTRNSKTTNAEFMDYVEVKWLFFHSSVLVDVEAMLPDLGSIEQVICIDSDKTEYPSLETFCLTGNDTCPDWSDPFSAPDVIFSRWPTGGTTGPSKAVEISNRSMCTMIELGLRYYIGDLEDNVVHLAVAPITHAAGVIISIYAAVSGTTYILPQFEADRVLDVVESERVTHMFLPPTAYYGLLEAGSRRNRDTSSLRQLMISAAPVAPDKLRQGVDVFGAVICQSYGQAESPLLISWLSPKALAASVAGEHPERMSSCGRITSAVRVAILDDEDNPVAFGERGEICTRGSLTTPGYFKKPNATAEIRSGGWHHTGDVGTLDEYGFLYIVDRLKDMIITGGFNVFAAEVEAPILGLPEVLECAVVGVADIHWGESVKAIVVLKNNLPLTEDELINRIRPKLGSVKTPKSIEFWDQIPKTSVGKTDKKVIRQILKDR